METAFQFFSTTFNTSVSKDYFINPSCFGYDLAEWLIAKLNASSIATSAKPAQEDFGWFFTFCLDGTEYRVVVGFQPNDPATGDCWIGWVERQVGFFASILGGRKRGVSQDAIAVLDKVLRSSSEIRDLKWCRPEAL